MEAYRGNRDWIVCELDPSPHTKCVLCERVDDCELTHSRQKYFDDTLLRYYKKTQTQPKNQTTTNPPGLRSIHPEYLYICVQKNCNSKTQIHTP